MTEKDFIPSSYSQSVEEGTTEWSAPSNIALVKYWGKLPHQIPANPSISFTLSTSRTNTSIQFKIKEKPSDDFHFDFFFEGKERPDFRPKIQTFFERIVVYAPFLTKFYFEIHSENTFPHSSGIASSASSMAALAVCLMQIEKQLNPQMSEEYFWQKASFLARLGSGSACRSVKGNIVIWGENDSFEGSSNLYGIPFSEKLDPIFEDYQDTILLIDKGQKTVSSTAGHQLMHSHWYADTRFAQAHQNLDTLKKALMEGDLETFIKIVESEALTLHAMMMTSLPYFILMKPNTLEVIQRIWQYREQTQVPICFTLDAGANVHILYPKKYQKECREFIESELLDYCENKQYLCDNLAN